MLLIDAGAIRAAVATLVVGLALAGCDKGSAAPANAEKPATVEAIAGSSIKRITLVPAAAERLGVKTSTVNETTVDGQLVRTVPYGALLYDADGKTWVYTNPQPLVFVRQAVTVIRIEKDLVLLSDGPLAGTEVASVAVSLLYGTEVGVGK